jgi:hypothetical protein
MIELVTLRGTICNYVLHDDFAVLCGQSVDSSQTWDIRKRERVVNRIRLDEEHMEKTSEDSTCQTRSRKTQKKAETVVIRGVGEGGKGSEDSSQAQSTRIRTQRV